MGTDTKGYLSREIPVNKIFNVIITKYDENATIETEIGEDYKVETASIIFKDGEDQRMLWVYRELTGNKKTSLSLGYWNNSVEIMTNIIKCFGGELLENDCSGLTAIDIPKDENYNHFDRVKMENTNSFNYQFLDRLQSDCKYYLGYGNRNKKHLYYLDEQKHIDEMKKLYNSFPADEKPEWLTWKQILKYEKEMVNN